MENKELEIIVKESGLEKTQGQFILDSFSSFIKEATEWEKKAKTIVITDISQVEEMQNAREARLALKTIRVNAENTRKSLKEKALREGKAIDGVANVIKALIVPIEEYLEAQEKFAENLEVERKAKIEAQRSLELQKYVEDITLYNFKDMSDEAFNNLVATLKLAFEVRQKAIQEANEELERQAKKEKEDAEKNKLEVERLKKEAEAREKLEAEMKAKKEAEEKANKEKEVKLQAEKLAKMEADKKAEMAPDRDKLLAYAVELGTLEVPKLETKEAKATLSKALKLLGEVVALLKSN